MSSKPGPPTACRAPQPRSHRQLRRLAGYKRPSVACRRACPDCCANVGQASRSSSCSPPSLSAAPSGQRTRACLMRTPSSAENPGASTALRRGTTAPVGTFHRRRRARSSTPTATRTSALIRFRVLEGERARVGADAARGGKSGFACEAAHGSHHPDARALTTQSGMSPMPSYHFDLTLRNPTAGARFIVSPGTFPYEHSNHPYPGRSEEEITLHVSQAHAASYSLTRLSFASPLIQIRARHPRHRAANRPGHDALPRKNSLASTLVSELSGPRLQHVVEREFANQMLRIGRIH